MESTDNRIGSFLRARRELVQPEQVGLQGGGRRRVPGLRREELALLAGVSADYYVRLEQGRDQHPSAQVLEALARALQLDDDAAAHLHSLAEPPVRRRARQRPDKIAPGVLAMVDAWPYTPALLVNRRLDVLAANPMATALNPACVPGVNLVRRLFLDEAAARALHPEYETVIAETVAALRAYAGGHDDDPALIDLVGELSLKSERFRRLWARHDVRVKSTGRKRYAHPLVGELDLGYQTLAVNGSDGQELVVYHAEPGSASEQALALLAQLM